MMNSSTSSRIQFTVSATKGKHSTPYTHWCPPSRPSSHIRPRHPPLFSRSSDDRANTSASDGNSAAVPSCPTSTTVQVSPIPPPAEALRPRCPFKLATFIVRTLMHIGQQAGLARTLETLTIDVCCIQETRIQDSSFIIRLKSPSNPSVKFHLRLSGDPEAAASGLAGVGVALSERAE
ncbi:unnamed protein product, partial [Echinostoma caproni]|uniref:Uncharacterized protein n=1 Tax=Echinostoma caproni TaxID=27848 RepID=A0A183BEK8_9TREM